jgi:hypothetical protein
VQYVNRDAKPARSWSRRPYSSARCAIRAAVDSRSPWARRAISASRSRSERRDGFVLVMLIPHMPPTFAHDASPRFRSRTTITANTVWTEVRIEQVRSRKQEVIDYSVIEAARHPPTRSGTNTYHARHASVALEGGAGRRAGKARTSSRARRAGRTARTGESAPERLAARAGHRGARPGRASAATRPPSARPGRPPGGCPRGRRASSASCLPSASRGACACARCLRRSTWR